jgi:hypothetical protein
MIPVKRRQRYVGLAKENLRHYDVEKIEQLTRDSKRASMITVGSSIQYPVDLNNHEAVALELDAI